MMGRLRILPELDREALMGRVRELKAEGKSQAEIAIAIGCAPATVQKWLAHEGVWLVWSEEHGAWWGAGKAGYTRSIVEAGRYSEAEAKGIEENANRHRKGGFNEVALPDPVRK